jgi:hypothetical protein
MSYLFGDSTPSKLEVNYIEFLRDAVEFSVQVLLADQRITQARTQTRSLEHATVAEVERLQKLAPLVAKALEGAPPGAADSPTARCAAAITNSANELVRVEAIRMRDALDAEIAKRDAQAGQERDGSVKALGALVVKHDLPGTVVEMHLTMAAGRYAGRARLKTGCGLEAVVDLEIPAGNLFERAVRIDRLMERLDVQAPEDGGWLHKEVKKRPQHLEKHHVVEFAFGASSGALKLRLNADGTGPGFDVLFAKDAPRVRLARVDQQAEEPFEVDEDDAKNLLALYGKLAAPAMELGTPRRRLVEARIDGEVMRNHAKPAVLVERLIEAMAPVVQEIASRSHSPGELVLRRLLTGDRREEIFLSKAELKAKVEPLTDGNRALFDPLWAIPAAPPSSLPFAKAAAVESASPTAVPPQAQTIRPRPGTPSLGTPPLSTSMPGPVVRAALDAPPPAEALRRTLIGATVEAAVQSLTQQPPPPPPAAVPPADTVSKTPLADPSRMEPLRKEAAGTIGVSKGKDADPTAKN